MRRFSWRGGNVAQTFKKRDKTHSKDVLFFFYENIDAYLLRVFISNSIHMLTIMV